MLIHVIFWVVTPCDDVVGYRLGGPCCLHLPDEVNVNCMQTCILYS